jgi:hypothetical protein
VCAQGGEPLQPIKTTTATASAASVSSATRVFNVLLPVVLLVAAVAINYYLSNKATA